MQLLLKTYRGRIAVEGSVLICRVGDIAAFETRRLCPGAFHTRFPFCCLVSGTASGNVPKREATE